jgi:Zn-dependent peptidase ImmA (M78 family)
VKRDAAIIATQFAEKLLRDRGITSLPVDPFVLAEAEGVAVQAKPDTAPGVSGLLMYVGSSFGIMYATHLKNDGYERFSVAHELGHYFLPGHIDAILPDQTSVHTSRAGFVSDDPNEIEADHFAAGLLMPDPMFRSALIKTDDGLAGIEHLAGLCRTSLTSTAIRYAEKATIPAAIIVSAGNSIDYCFMTTALKDFKDLQWLKKGMPLPRSVVTRSFNADSGNILNARRDEGDTNLQDWFGGKQSVEAREEVIGLRGYGKTLTVITCDTFADELEEEEGIEERLTPRWR